MLKWILWRNRAVLRCHNRQWRSANAWRGNCVCQRIGYILDYESPRKHASSIVAWKALRWKRIFLRMDQRSKTTSHLQRDWDTMQHGELRSDRGSWLVNEFFLRFSFFNINHTVNAGDSSHIFLKLVYFTNHNCVKRQWDSRKGRSVWDRFLSQSCQANVLKGKNGETRWPSQPKIQNQIKTKTTIKNGETCIIPIYRNGCNNSEKILWMTEFLNMWRSCFRPGANLLSESARAGYPRHQGSRRCKAAGRAGRSERWWGRRWIEWRNRRDHSPCVRNMRMTMGWMKAQTWAGQAFEPMQCAIMWGRNCATDEDNTNN